MPASKMKTESFIGMNKYIHDVVLKDDILKQFRLVNAKNDIERFLSKTSFNSKIEKAILISNKALRRHGKEKAFHPFLSKLAKIETGVQLYNPILRDHTTHSVYVFLLGLLFVLRIGSIRTIDPLSWKIASLLHDIGYPLQLFSSSIKEYLNLVHEYRFKISDLSVPVNYSLSLKGFEKLKFSDNDAFSCIETRLKEWDINLDLQGIYIQHQKEGEINHGILSALIVINIIDSIYARKNPKREESKIVEGIDWGKNCFNTQILDAVSAISLHDILDKVDKIHFENSPIAYLLVLCDNLQQWDRYSPKQEVYNPSCLELGFSGHQITYKLSLREGKIQEIQEVIDNKLQAYAFNLVEH